MKRPCSLPLLIVLASLGFAFGLAAFGARQGVVGRLADEAGNPIQGGLVQLFAEDANSGHRSQERVVAYEAASGWDGVFEIAQVDSGHYSAVVFADRFAPTPINLFVAQEGGETDLGTQTLSVGKPIRGIVVGEDDQPLAGVKVVLVRIQVLQKGLAFDPRLARQPAAVTTADGAFRLGNIEPRMVATLEATADGFGSEVVSLAPLSSSNEPLRIALARRSRVKGRILDREGRPLRNVVAWVITQRGSNRGGGGTSSSSSSVYRVDESGRFEIGHLKPGHLSVGVSTTPGSRGSMILRTFPDLLPGEVRELEIVQGQGRSVEGIVVDPEGSPLADVSVFAEGMEYGFQERTTTDDRGRFRFDDWPQCDLRMRVENGSFDFIEVKAEERFIRLTGVRTFELSGRVLDPAGRPVPEAGVTLFRSVGTGHASTKLNADEQGNFRFKVPAGSYSIRVSHDSYAPNETSFQARGLREPAAFVEVRLRPGIQAAGKIADLDPSRYASVDLQAVWTSHGAIVDGSFGVHRQGYVDSDGVAHIPGVGPGLWRVEARDEKAGWATILHFTVDQGQASASIPFQRAEGAEVRLLVLRNGEPKPEERVTLLRSDGLSVPGVPTSAPVVAAKVQAQQRPHREFRMRRTGQDGTARFAGLLPGKYLLMASMTGFNKWVPVEVAASEKREVVVEFSTGELQGIVRQESGAPVPQAHIRLSSDIQHAVAGSSLTTADVNGAFAFQDIPLGEYELVVEAEGFPVDTRTVVVKGDDAWADVTLRCGRSHSDRGADRLGRACPIFVRRDDQT